MKKVTTLVIVSILALTQLTVAQSTFNFQLNGNGARAAGMGYAFTGLADDASAISWNPAGLSQLYQMEASIIGRLGFGSASIEGFDASIIDSWDVDVSSSFQLNFASFIVPFAVGDFNVVGGVAYRRMFDFTGELTQMVSGPGLIGDIEFYDNTEGAINAISPALGVQVHDMISIGTTVNIMTGTEDGNGDLKVDGVVDPTSEYDYSRDYSGVAVDVGLLLKPNEKFSIGATFNLPHTRTVEGDGFEFDIDVPMFFTVGAAFRASDQFLLSFDYRNRPVSGLEVEGIDPELEDMNSIHAGLEFLMESGDTYIPIRLGFYTDPWQRLDANDDQVVSNVFTAGIGFSLGNLILDGAFEWAMTSFEEQDLVSLGNETVDFSSDEFRFTIGAVLHLGE